MGVSLPSCSPSGDSTPSQFNRDLEHNNASSSDQLRTATAPAFPDLRGSDFDLVLIQTEDETYSPLLESIEAGIEDGIRQLNSSGGINGARINLTRKSFPPDLGNIGSEITDYILQIDPTLIFIAYPLNEGLIADLNHLGIPIFSFGIGNEDGGRTTSSSENFFWLVPPPEIQIAFYLSEVWKHWEQLRPTGIFNQLT
ncbi:MAG: hypothetical protein P8Y68_17120, partial [Anaerolineales bacterium]